MKKSILNNEALKVMREISLKAETGYIYDWLYNNTNKRFKPMIDAIDDAQGVYDIHSQALEVMIKANCRLKFIQDAKKEFNIKVDNSWII